MSTVFAAARRAAFLVAVSASVTAWALPGPAANSVQDVLAARQSATAAGSAMTAHSRQATTASAPDAANEIYASPYRAYPPSCLSDGLPFRSFPQTPTDPAAVQATLTLPGDPAACLSASTAAECPVSPGNYSEAVTVTAWRVACSGGKSAVLVEFDRGASKEGNTTFYPTFPAIAITQNGHTLFPVRLADDPNTFFTTTLSNTPLYSSDIFVLENYFNSTDQQIDYNKAFTLIFDNTLQFTFPDYNAGQYAAASQAVPISGYMSSNWYDPAHGGEGVLTQIFDNNDGQTRTFSAAWYTFDKTGLPFWLYTQGSINIGAKSTGNLPVYYATNGGFAGAFGSSATFTQWGTMSFKFPDCSHMTFTFNGNADAVNGPTTNGTNLQRTWLRIANINSITCQ